ncbi:MAG: lipoyl(octanoyl) transferase LipB [Bacteroidetes bacterium]|nr:lipoyl(octanoyl) transferase LipB [Bacteroidota bacterium]MBS1975566.1 lipoyl(octanoyl) transferase LipB [Bacteroidota bacterium]
MSKQQVFFEDLGTMPYKQAWDLQESLLRKNLMAKSEAFSSRPDKNRRPQTTNYLLFVEHPPVYTLGKSGHEDNILITAEEMNARAIEFYSTNRGGDITFHGPGQIVGYPILDLENFFTDIGKYMRNLEEVIIQVLAEYNIDSGRSSGETGVWLEAGKPGRERKICAMGVRCSRWITMHGFALNVNTDLSYFNFIIPCGIQNKQVASMEKELGRKISMEEVKQKLKQKFEKVFDCEMSYDNGLVVHQ